MKKHAFPWMVFSLLCGILASLPLLSEKIPFLSFILFVPYFLFLRTRDGVPTLRFYYLSGLFFFFGYYGGAFSFFSAMYPLDFAGLGTLESIAVLFAAMVLLPLFQAWFSAFAVFLLGLLHKKGAFCFPLAFSLTLSALYTLFAFAQNFTWAGVPWANTAVGIASSPLLIQGASVFGSAFLIFFIVFVNAALAEGFVAFRECKSKSALICLVCAVCLLLSQMLFGGIRLLTEKSDGEEIRVAMIQGCAPATSGVSILRHLRACEDLALAASKEDVDLMLWSESVITYALESDEARQTFFANLAKQTGAMQVVGAFSNEQTPNGEEGYYNALFLFLPDGTMHEETYQKQRPVPFGEYVPMAWLFERLIPALTEISMLSRGTNAGEESVVLHTKTAELGGLICFDSIYPALARESVRNGAELILLSTDDSWFDGSFGKSLHMRHAALRAVENARNVVRTGNTGQSGVLNSHGALVYAIPMDESAYGVFTVSLSNETTLYTALGDVFPCLCLAFLVFLPYYTHKKTSSKE